MTTTHIYCDNGECRVCTILARYADVVYCDDTFLHAMLCDEELADDRYTEFVAKLYDKACKQKNFDYERLLTVGPGVYTVYRDYPVFKDKFVCGSGLAMDHGEDAVAEVLLKNFILSATLSKTPVGMNVPAVCSIVRSMADLDEVFASLGNGADMAIINIKDGVHTSGAFTRPGFTVRFSDHEDGTIVIIMPAVRDCALKYMACDVGVVDGKLKILRPQSFNRGDPVDGDLRDALEDMAVGCDARVPIDCNVMDQDVLVDLKAVEQQQYPAGIDVVARSLDHLLRDFVSQAPTVDNVHSGFKCLYDYAWCFIVLRPYYRDRSADFELALADVYRGALLAHDKIVVGVLGSGSGRWDKLAKAVKSLGRSIFMHIGNVIERSELKIEQLLVQVVRALPPDDKPVLPIRELVMCLFPIVHAVQLRGHFSTVLQMALRSTLLMLYEDIVAEKFKPSVMDVYVRRYAARLMGITGAIVCVMDLMPAMMYPRSSASVLTVYSKFKYKPGPGSYFEHYRTHIEPILLGMDLTMRTDNFVTQMLGQGYCYLNLFKPRYYRCVLAHVAYTTEVTALEILELLQYYGFDALSSWVYVAKIKSFRQGVVMHLYSAVAAKPLVKADTVRRMRSLEYIVKVCYDAGHFIAPKTADYRAKKLAEERVRRLQVDKQRTKFHSTVANVGLLA